MVARLFFWSVSLAQKPKSARKIALVLQKKWVKRKGLTDLDVAAGVKEDIVRLDIAVDDVLRVKVRQSFASLWASQCCQLA